MTVTIARVECEVDGCTQDAQRMGKCGKHYMRWYRWGTTDLIGARRKPCQRCGQEFQPVNNRQVYCSDACKNGRTTCEICSATFEPSKNSAGRFCSRACWMASKLVFTKCPICEREFRGPSETCSAPCGHEMRRRRTAEKAIECPRACRHCRGPIPSRKKTAIFCSRSCSNGGRPIGIGSGHVYPEGTRTPRRDGYIDIKTNGRWMREHRYVMEQVLGRTLHPRERVHHKNGQRGDNRPENLELWKLGTKDPAGVRAADYHCAGCRCGELDRS